MRRGRLVRRPPGRAGGEEGLIPLVNVVFLLMLFFMIAGEIAPQDRSGVRVPDTSRVLEGGARVDELLVDAEGVPRAPDGLPVDPEAIRPGPLALRIDAAADALQVVGLVRRLEQAGAAPLYLVLEER